MDMKRLKTSMWTLLTESPEKPTDVSDAERKVMYPLCLCLQAYKVVHWLWLWVISEQTRSQSEMLAVFICYYMSVWWVCALMFPAGAADCGETRGVWGESLQSDHKDAASKVPAERTSCHDTPLMRMNNGWKGSACKYMCLCVGFDLSYRYGIHLYWYVSFYIYFKIFVSYIIWMLLWISEKQNQQDLKATAGFNGMIDWMEN